MKEKHQRMRLIARMRARYPVAVGFAYLAPEAASLGAFLEQIR